MPAADKSAQLRSAFNLPPQGAIDFMAAKTNKPSWYWAEVYQDAHRKAFTVAKVMRGDILQDFREGVTKIFTNGLTPDQFVSHMTPVLKAKGWWGKQTVKGPNGEETVQLGSPWRLRNIYRINTTTARAAGQWKAMLANAKHRPYLQYLATLDKRTRPSHGAMHGKVFRIDDPIWRWLMPPNDWGCRCRVRALSEADLKRMGLKVSLGTKHITFEDRLNPSTGELTQVAVYTDPKTGKKFAAGPGWSYNPGMGEKEVDLGKMDLDLAERVKNGIKGEGFAKRFPVTKLAEADKMLKAYDKESPGLFAIPFKEFEVMNSNAFMAATNAGKIYLSEQKFKSGYNPYDSLMSALRKISTETTLTFDEEYSIEGLWHEIGHLRQKKWANLAPGSMNLMAVEALNQWQARRTYSVFLKDLGGKAAHFEKILTDGYGYRYEVANFRTILAKLKIDEEGFLGEGKNVLFETDETKMAATLAKVIAKASDQDAKLVSALLSAMGRDPKIFEPWCGEYIKNWPKPEVKPDVKPKQ